MIVAVPVALLAGSYAIAFYLPFRLILLIVGGVYVLTAVAAWVVVHWWRSATFRHRRVTLVACAAAVFISQAIPRPGLRSSTSGGIRHVNVKEYVLGPIELDVDDAFEISVITRVSGIGWPWHIWEWRRSDWSGRVQIAGVWKDAPLEWFREPWSGLSGWLQHQRPGVTISRSRLRWVSRNAFCCVLIAFAVVGLCPTAHRYVRELRRIPPGHCKCGYNLTGNVSGRCPECGKETDTVDSVA